jgi:hypothetical protein
MGEAISMIVSNHPSIASLKKSLLFPPPTDELLVKYWIQKKGHIIRSLKKRYCVIEKSEIKYYSQPHPDPPYGKHLKGHVSLSGAVCMVEESEDFTIINVEIFGGLGENDLCFSIDNTEEGKEFINIVQWAIRKATMATLIRKAKTSAAYKVTRKQLQATGADWMKHHEILYEESIKGIKFPQIFEFVVVTPDGGIVIRPGIMKLWTAYGEDFTPSLRTDAELMGLAIHIWNEKDSNVLDLNEDRESYAILTFADIADISYQYIEKSTTKWLKPNVQKFLHKQCSCSRYLVFTIISEFGMAYHILSCCLHGYDDAFMYLQNILLFIQTRKKLFDSAMSEKTGKSKFKPPVVDALAAVNE